MDGVVEEKRSRSRYLVRGSLSGFFGQVDVSVCDLSHTGIQLEHPAPLRVGTRARGAIVHQKQATPFHAVITRSKLSTTPNGSGKLLYRSGARFEDPGPALIELVNQLLREGVLVEDPESLERKRAKLAARFAPKEQPAMRILRPVVAIPSDQLLLVRQARERLRAHPEEARNWYNRIRFVEPEHAAILARSSFRDEVLVVWEYLERSVELSIVAAAFESPQS